MNNKKTALIVLTVIEAICLVSLRNEPYMYILMLITLALWIITALQIRRC